MTASSDTKKFQWPSLVLFLIISAGAIVVGQFFPPGEWFESLNKPAINPPGWVFPVVWTPLYVMIAVAGWLIWKTDAKSTAMKLWVVQMVLNVAWSMIFFGAHRPGLALIEIFVLWLAIGGTILAARRLSPLAAWLLVPYWLWVSFATVLNASFWWLNR